MIEALGIVLGLIGTLLSIGSAVFWWSEQQSKNATKSYAAEREFGHIKNSLANLSTNLSNEFQDIERRLDTIRDDISEIKHQIKIGK